MVGISDGLGFEEVNQDVTFTEIISGTVLYGATSISGAAVNTTTLTATTANATTISGTNVYAQTNIIGENVYGDTTISGATLKATTGSIGTIKNTTFNGTTISATGISATTISGTTISGTTLFGGTARVSLGSAVAFSGGGFNISTTGPLRSVSIGSPSAVYGAKIQAGSGALGTGSTGWIVFPVAYTGLPSVYVTDSKTIAKAIGIAAGSLTAGSCLVHGETASDTFTWISVGI